MHFILQAGTKLGGDKAKAAIGTKRARTTGRSMKCGKEQKHSTAGRDSDQVGWQRSGHTAGAAAAGRPEAHTVGRWLWQWLTFSESARLLCALLAQ